MDTTRHFRKDAVRLSIECAGARPISDGEKDQLTFAGLILFLPNLVIMRYTM